MPISKANAFQLLVVLFALASGIAVGEALEGDRSGAPAPAQTRTWPGAEWRPYADSSPFNVPVEPGARVAAASSRYTTSLLESGATIPLIAGDTWRDSGTAFYWTTEGDPLLRIHCADGAETCSAEGDRIHVPDGALPAGSRLASGSGSFPSDHDAHMSLIQPDGLEYDLWNVRSIDERVIVAGRAGSTRIDGQGLGSDAVVADFGNYAGEIRPEELASGELDHALAMAVPCSLGSVYPAPPSGARGDLCGPELSADRAIPVGTRFVLDMSTEEIAALALPPWKEAILGALADYGAYVRDTTGDPRQWGFEFESPASRTSLGLEDPWLRFALEEGADGPHDYNSNGQSEYWLYLDDSDGTRSLPWDRLVALAPCTVPGAPRPC